MALALALGGNARALGRKFSKATPRLCRFDRTGHGVTEKFDLETTTTFLPVNLANVLDLEVVHYGETKAVVHVTYTSGRQHFFTIFKNTRSKS